MIKYYWNWFWLMWKNRKIKDSRQKGRRLKREFAKMGGSRR